MSSYRKTAVIEAVHWDGKHFSEMPSWLEEALKKGMAEMGSISIWDDHLRLQTEEGRMTGNPDCYVIRGVNGEIYACAGDIFKKTYEVVG